MCYDMLCAYQDHHGDCTLYGKPRPEDAECTKMGEEIKKFEHAQQEEERCSVCGGKEIRTFIGVAEGGCHKERDGWVCEDCDAYRFSDD